MIQEWLLLPLFVIQLTLLYFVTRTTINEMFYILRIFFHNDHIVFSLISFIFLPGTILHELSHFFMAMILFLNVREINILPRWEGNYIKLGSVIYEKRDVFRSILVGIAPVIVGLLFFWWMSSVQIFPNQDWRIQVVLIYIMFLVSSTMFSSKQDLVDIVYIIPLFILIGVLLFIFQIDIVSLVSRNRVIVANLNRFLYAINWYLVISLVIHIGLIGTMKLFRTLFKKNYK